MLLIRVSDERLSVLSVFISSRFLHHHRRPPLAICAGVSLLIRELTSIISAFRGGLKRQSINTCVCLCVKHGSETCLHGEEDVSNRFIAFSSRRLQKFNVLLPPKKRTGLGHFMLLLLLLRKLEDEKNHDKDPRAEEEEEEEDTTQQAFNP
ncbi:hypothetical protein JOB18_007140 [Solea senegalensis]|uniref:Uncharacterized protein n=1 Tax=Solea senegalensis TaxID=28829 RepID=A0AAV6T3Q3_SOLSE|nr:hypothetical protein JOB18_007140 [Solea senegalensis]